MTWNEIIKEEEQKEYYKSLIKFINDDYENKTIYPKKELIFNAFNLTPYDKVKVVIIGQDPYHTPGFAMGLAFSVNDGIEIPKSLVNIYKELYNELGIIAPNSGNLSKWAKNGVLLLNRILTVEKGKPLAHKNKGWEEFTSNILLKLNESPNKIVYLLFGNEAKQLGQLITNPNHLVLKTSHPSPLGAYKGFFGSGVFKQTIEFLDETKDFWRLS
jgi:uracil-DNA glycosylase